jgi:tetratricopeptide (TPR) repeat protein
MEEQSGMEEEALTHYKSALTLYPLFEITHFFNGSEIRKQAVAQYEPFQTLTFSGQFALEGKRLLNSGNLTEAKKYLLKAIEINAYNGEAYAWLAQLQLLQGHEDEAWTTIKLAIFVDSTSPIVLTIASEIAQEKGDDNQALQYLLNAYEVLQRNNQSTDYYSGVYRRSILNRDLVPQIIVPELSSHSLEDFSQLSNHPEIFTDQADVNEFIKWLEAERRQ